MCKTVLVDICGTIFYSNTTFDFLDSFIKKKSYKIFRLLSKTYFGRAINKIFILCFKIDIIRTIAVHYLKGINKSFLLEKAYEFYDHFLIKKQNKTIINKIHNFQENKFRVILASATLDFIAEVIADKLNIAVYFGTELDYNTANVCTGKIKKDRLGYKLRALNNIQIEIPYYCTITDNITDIDILQNSDNAIIIKYLHTKNKWNKLINTHKINITEEYYYDK